MPNDNDVHTIKCEGMVVRETAAGIRLQVWIWLPKKAIEYLRYADGEESTRARIGAWITHLAIPYWLAKRKGLVDANDDERQSA